MPVDDDVRGKNQSSRHSSSIDTICGLSPNISETDLQAVEQQLGYRPTNVCSIAARGMDGHPTVLKLYPLKSDLKAYKVHRTNGQTDGQTDKRKT